MAKDYAESIEFQIDVKQFAALALIPPEDVKFAFKELKLKASPKLEKFIFYIEDTWVGRGELGKAMYTIELWNQYENALSGSQKTNNAVEATHRAFQKSLSIVHPKFSKFINLLQKEQTITENKIEQAEAGYPQKKRKRDEKNYDYIKNILENYRKDNLQAILKGLSRRVVF